MMTLHDKISIQIRLRFRDYLDAYRLHRAAATKEKDSHTIIGFVLLLLGGLFLAFLLVQPPPNNFDVPYAIAILAIGAISILDLLPVGLSWLQSRQHIKQYPKPFQITFEDSGIRIDGRDSYAVYEWNFFQDALEGKTVFILIYGKGLYSTIPKSALQTETEVEVFRNILRDHFRNFRQELRF